MITHLTEDERQGMADDSLPGARRALIEQHALECPACASDVARLRTLISTARADLPALHSSDDAWPAIRARIERGKVVELPGVDGPRRRWSLAAFGRRQWWTTIGLSAATILILGTSYRAARPVASDSVAVRIGDRVVRNAVDSAASTERQIAVLLDELELRRSMLRPESAAAIDADLDVVNKAIGELRAALARDPNNSALRQLLASANRQKLDLLHRAGNAS